MPRETKDILSVLSSSSSKKAGEVNLAEHAPEQLLVARKSVALLRNRGWIDEAQEFERACGLPPVDFDGETNGVVGDRVLGVAHGTVLSTMHFRELNDPADKRLAVKNGLRLIDIEIFSQCNRRCHYCSNSVLDRFSGNKFIDVELYRGVLTDLSEVDWDGQFRFIGLNEPTMHREFLIARLREAKNIIPRAQLTIYTNGDYLRRDYLEDIYDAGCRALYISVHLTQSAPFNDKKILWRIALLARRLGVEYHIEQHVPGISVLGFMTFRDMRIQIFQQDYANVGHDRGGILEGIGPHDYVRTAACLAPTRMMVISYNGNVLPCCHFVGDAPQHQGLIVGKLGQGRSIFDIYASREYLAWRRGLYSVGPKSKECRNCMDHADNALLNDANVVAMAACDRTDASAEHIEVIGGGGPRSLPVEGVFRVRRSAS